MNMTIEIYFETSCKKNLNLYLGFVVVNGKIERNFYHLVPDVDQNLIELKGFIHGMEIVKDLGLSSDNFNVYLSSKNIIRCFEEGWIDKWQKNDWKNSSKKPVKHKEHWEELSDYFYEYLPKLIHSNQFKRKEKVTHLRRLAKSNIRKISKK